MSNASIAMIVLTALAAIIVFVGLSKESNKSHSKNSHH